MSYDQTPPSTQPLEEDKPKQGEQTITGWDPEAPNLVDFFLGELDPEEVNPPETPGRKFLADVAKQACDDTNQGWDDSEQYRQKRKRIISLYVGHLKNKTFPFPGCANVHMPLTLERTQRVVANTFTEIFGDRELVYGVRPTESADDDVAELLTVHGNWRLRNEMPDFMTSMEEALTEFFLCGSVIVFSYRDQALGKNEHEVLTPEEVVVPYVFKAKALDMHDVPWKTRILRKYKHEVQAMSDSGEWSAVQVAKIVKVAPPANDFMTTVVRDLGEQMEGNRQPSEGSNTRNAPYVFYEYHGRYRMPGETTDRPICVTVSADHKTVVKLYIREKPDWRDQMRAERQTAELQQFQDDTANFPQAQAMFEQASADYAMVAQQPQMDPMTGQPLPPPPPPEAPVPPAPPSWAQPDEATGGYLPPDPPKRVPIEMFTHIRYAYNPAGMLGLGMGHILQPFNESVDEALNRFYDQATANNCPAILSTQDLGLGQSSALVPNQIKVLKNVSEDINKVVKEFRPGPANPQLLDYVREAVQWADSAVAAPGILSGQPGKSGETFRGVATRAEKASKQLTFGAKKFCAGVEQVLKNDAELLATFMPEEEFVQVNDHLADYRKSTKDQGTIRITREMYRKNYDISFTADLQFSSRAQRIAESDEVLAMVNQVFPPLPPGVPVQDPMAALRYHAVADALRSRGKQDMIGILGPVPPAPIDPMGTPIVPPPMMGQPVGPDGQPLPPPEGEPPPPGIPGPQPEAPIQ